MSDYDSLLADATRLPIDIRVQLIEALWDTVPDDKAPALSDEWLAEIEKRSGEFDAGLAKPTPWEEIRAAALARLSSTR
jgi:putative addiction module component (TIGR02574 family)